MENRLEEARVFFGEVSDFEFCGWGDFQGGGGCIFGGHVVCCLNGGFTWVQGMGGHGHSAEERTAMMTTRGESMVEMAFVSSFSSFAAVGALDIAKRSAFLPARKLR